MAAPPIPVAGRRRLSGIPIALLTVYCIWGSTFLALRYMVQDFPPLLGSGVRFVLAGTVIYGATRLWGAPPLTRTQWAWSLLIGTLMFFVGNGLVAIAAREVPSGLTALSIGAVPLFLAALESMTGQPIRRRQWLGMAFGFTGVLYLGSVEGTAASGPLLLLLIAPVGWAAASLLVRRLSATGVNDGPSPQGSAALPAGPVAGGAQLLGGGASLLLGGLAHGERFEHWPGPSASLAFLYLVVCGSIVAFSAALYLLRTASAPVATSYAYVNPVVAVALGTWLGGERLPLSTWVGAALIVVGVAMLVTHPREAVR